MLTGSAVDEMLATVSLMSSQQMILHVVTTRSWYQGHSVRLPWEGTLGKHTHGFPQISPPPPFPSADLALTKRSGFGIRL